MNCKKTEQNSKIIILDERRKNRMPPKRKRKGKRKGTSSGMIDSQVKYQEET